MQSENNRIATISSDKLNRTNDLKVDSNTNVKHGAMSKNIKFTDISSKIFKFSGINKDGKTVVGDLPLSSSSKNLHADQSMQRGAATTLFPNISSKTHNHAKKGESAITLSPHTSVKTHQHARASEQQESASVLSPNFSSKPLQKFNTSEQSNSAKVSSPNISSKTASKSEQTPKISKPRSQSMSEKSSRTDWQLVPYEKHPKSPVCNQNLQTSPRQARNFYDFMSPNVSGYSPITEITATKRMTVAPWGVTQEEYQIHQRTFYPMTGFSPKYGLRPTLNCNSNNSGVQEYQLNQTTFYPTHIRSRISTNVSRPKLDNDQTERSSSMYSQPRQNKISDVLTQLEAMNIFH